MRDVAKEGLRRFLADQFTHAPADQQDRVAYLEPPQLRVEGMRATVEVLESLAAREPLVLFFEDLHWADEASI